MNRDSTFKVLTLNTKDSNGKEPPQQDRVYNTDGLITTISAQLNGLCLLMKMITIRLQKFLQNLSYIVMKINKVN